MFLICVLEAHISRPCTIVEKPDAVNPSSCYNAGVIFS